MAFSDLGRFGEALGGGLDFGGVHEGPKVLGRVRVQRRRLGGSSGGLGGARRGRRLRMERRDSFRVAGARTGFHRIELHPHDRRARDRLRRPLVRPVEERDAVRRLDCR
jgi:hypothetical protein